LRYESRSWILEILRRKEKENDGKLKKTEKSIIQQQFKFKLLRLRSRLKKQTKIEKIEKKKRIE
jgi:hypothetical protein